MVHHARVLVHASVHAHKQSTVRVHSAGRCSVQPYATVHVSVGTRVILQEHS